MDVSEERYEWVETLARPDAPHVAVGEEYHDDAAKWRRTENGWEVWCLVLRLPDDKYDRFIGMLEPRDPARIPVLLDALREEWYANTDLRFGQLVSNVIAKAKGGRVSETTIFNVEDDVWLDAIRNYRN